MNASLPNSNSLRQGGRSIPTRYLFFGLASVGFIMVSMDMTMIAVAIPSLTTALDTSLTWVGWVLTSAQLVQIVVMPVVGRLSDGFGRKRVFMLCMGSYLVGSLLSGLAPNIAFLILFRAIQAVGIGGLLPAAVGIISDQFEERRMQALGLISSIFPLGGLVGPIVAGWILQYLSWRWLFFVTPPVSLIVLLGAQLVLREERRSGPRPRIDITGLAFFAASLVAIMYSMTWVGNDRAFWRSPLFWPLLASGLVLFYMFIRQERRVEEPIMDFQLVARKPFLHANLYNLLFGACVFGFGSFIPYYAVVQYQMGPAQSGAVLVPRALVMIPTAVVTSLLMVRLGYRIPMIGGALLVTTSLLLMSFGWSQASLGPLALDSFWLMALVVAVSGIGMGLAMPSSNNASLDLLPSKSAGITGLRGMFRQSGGLMGITSIVMVLSLFEDQAAGIRIVFLVFGLLFLVSIPLTLMIPDSARERWRSQRAAARASIPSAPVFASADGYVAGQLDPGVAGLDKSEVEEPSPPAFKPASRSPD